MTGSGRPPKPARERELRARTFGEAVDQEMERQAKLNGRAQITDVLYRSAADLISRLPTERHGAF